MGWKGLWIFVAWLVPAVVLGADQPIGQRPYEMVWAHRLQDNHPPLLDFENLDGWSVDVADSAATLVRSREQQLWGSYVGKLVYRGTGKRPTVTLKPPKPIPIPQVFDCINLWLYGNNWGWETDRTTPAVEIALLLRSPEGQSLRVVMGQVRWKEWWVMHQKLQPAQLALLQKGAVLEAIQISGGRNSEDRTLYFDNLACYREPLPPLKFDPRPLRGVEPFPGQTTGNNVGPGRLPFPTRPETILPDNLTKDFTTALEEQAGTFTFHYRGADGHLVYRYTPKAGTLGDLVAHWEGRGQPFQPLGDGGVRLWDPKQKTSLAPEKIEPVACRRDGDTVVSTWRYLQGEQVAEVTYAFRLWQKSLVVDVKCPGGRVGEFAVGKAVGAENPRLVTIPYLVCEQQRPAVLVAGPAETPLFTFAMLDYYRSNASRLWAVNGVTKEGVLYNGGSRYLPKTDGRLNDCFERLFLTVSPRFEEILPNIPNPKSPWMHVAGERLWRAHGAQRRDQDYAIWKQVARYGMTKIVITDHETGWRDGGESFTFRTRAAPGRGGDESQADYARKIRALGFRYGIYNNYTDFAPVNEYWDEDFVTRLSDGQFQTAWPRCYNPKPSRAVEMEAKLAPIIQQKFQLDTAYCDVHTAVTPWSYCDFDARVPGAGTFAATFYAYGEIMLHQKKTWNGPVYSEGNNHFYYCGLTDGNYAQDQVARLAENPWLIDFDLRKMHPLCCNFGMGSPDMFYVDRRKPGKRRSRPDDWLDRFLAATLAFGHTGFLVMEGGMTNAVRSYFALQPIHARYAQAEAAEIRYADEQGRLLDSSAAVAGGAFRRSQVVTRYSNGLVVAVNGHEDDAWKVGGAELPPNGWYAKDTKDGQLEAISGLVDGHRADYVDAPQFTYSDGRGRFTRFAKAASDGPMIAHRRSDGTVEVIPVGACAVFGVSVGGRAATAVALDAENNSLGAAQTRLSRGLVYVAPVAKAFSYLLTPTGTPARPLAAERDRIVPGETVTVTGTKEHRFQAPADARPGTILWHQADGQWLDFLVIALADAAAELDDGLRVQLTTRLPEAHRAEVTLAGKSHRVELQPGKTVDLHRPLPKSDSESVQPIDLVVTAGPLTMNRSWWLKTELANVPAAILSEQIEKGQCLRGKPEEPLTDRNHAAAHWADSTCGDVEKHGLFMHPPYAGATGYVFALFEPIALPSQPPAVFRCLVGKRDGSDPGDGILFRAAVVADGKETIVAEKSWIQHAWTPMEADLSPWAGKSVRLKLIADVGPKDNSSGDWACWAEMRLESKGRALRTTLHESPTQLDRQPGPQMLAGLKLEQLRAAKSGRLHYEAIGLGASAPYITKARLNGVELGPLPACGGNEVAGKWGAAALAISPEALARLAEWNELSLSNPGNDSFAIGRFWIELELRDGRKASSQVTDLRFKQPGEWIYGAGSPVPFGKDIEATIRFPIASGTSP